jgi:hypothetical protein
MNGASDKNISSYMISYIGHDALVFVPTQLLALSSRLILSNIIY